MKKLLPFVFSAVLFLGAAHTMPAQGPSLPSDFSAKITLTSVLPLGSMSAMVYEDFTNKRMRFDICSAKGNLIETLYLFYDKDIAYASLPGSTAPCGTNPVSPSCTKGSGSGIHVIHAPFGFLNSAVMESQITLSGQTIQQWATQVEDYPPEQTVITYNATTYSLETIQWITPNSLVVGQISNFVSGQPDATVFSLPAACAG